uniref:Uncharacterized protein n=1 Tax=Proboscia inermis TaxID=420281 RepID=A0A7S0CFB5_9STRA|mmetsp:Transcript_45393/g.45820  ORF Transcript_45393/g.45820 Transcript_45393/m.45820 type:complete len:227 (+) Transcript_45393:696-1376(+)
MKYKTTSAFSNVCKNMHRLRIVVPSLIPNFYVLDLKQLYRLIRAISDHPEGTGKEVCPFASIWYCGVCLKHIKSAKKIYNQISDCGNNLKNNGKERPILATSYHELKLLNVIPTLKRGNPRQRRKMKQKNQMLNYQQCLNEDVSDVKEEMKLTSLTSNEKSLKEIALFTRKEPKKDKRKRISSDGEPSKHVDMSQPIIMEDSKKLNKSKRKTIHRDANGFRKRRRF